MNHDVLAEMIHQLTKYTILVKLAACNIYYPKINKTISFSQLKEKIYMQKRKYPQLQTLCEI